MKNWILTKKTNIILTFIGAILGFAYWKFIGCDSGTCAITSVWYRVTIYGAIMGWLVGSFINEQINRSKTEKNE